MEEDILLNFSTERKNNWIAFSCFFILKRKISILGKGLQRMDSKISSSNQQISINLRTIF